MALEQAIAQDVPYRGKYRDWKNMTDEQVLQTIREKHGDIHAWALSRVDQYAYNILREKGLAVFLRNNIYWSEMTDRNILAFARDNYPGCNFPELKYKDESLYREIAKRELEDKFISSASQAKSRKAQRAQAEQSSQRGLLQRNHRP